MGGLTMKKRKNYDPRQLVIRYRCECFRCSVSLPRGAVAYYWPAGHRILCLQCGEAEYKLFLSSVADENVYNGTGNPY